MSFFPINQCSFSITRHVGNSNECKGCTPLENAPNCANASMILIKAYSQAPQGSVTFDLNAKCSDGKERSFEKLSLPSALKEVFSSCASQIKKG